MDQRESSMSIGAELDPYRDAYAARARGMVRSEIRALFAVANRPEIVSLSGGMPNLTALPMDAVGAMIRDLVADDGTEALQYGTGQGDPALRELICDVMAVEGIRARADDIVVTVGSQQGLDLVTRVFCDPGDVVLAEAPSYVGALGTFGAYQTEVVHCAIDEWGLIPAALVDTIAQLRSAGKRIKFLYVIPNFQNPAGSTMDLARRQEILQIAARERILVLEDNPYGLLCFDDEIRPALHSLNPDGVVYLGTFSKTFSPGLRVGWVVAPPGIREKLIIASESAVLCPPTFSQVIVRQYLRTASWNEQIKAFRGMYRERRDAMLDSLASLMPAGTSWSRPDGGFFVWLTLPEGLDAKAMLARAIGARVAYVVGSAFYADGSGNSHMRLSFCFPPPDRIREGIRRLAGVIESELELRDTFGPMRASGGSEVDAALRPDL